MSLPFSFWERDITQHLSTSHTGRTDNTSFPFFPVAFCATTQCESAGTHTNIHATDQKHSTSPTSSSFDPAIDQYRKYLEQASPFIHQAGFVDQHVDLVIDSRASSTSVSNKHEFTVLHENANDNVELDGIAAGLKVSGEGIVEYELTDDSGVTFIARSHAYWVPG